MSELDAKPEDDREGEEPATEATEASEAAGSAAADPYGGTGGAIGSGPTGDVRNSPEILDEGPDRTPLIAAAAGFLTGLVLGWAIWR